MKKDLLKAEHLHFSVFNRSLPILNDVSFTLYEHDFVVLLGGNGSGKSSLLKIINQHYRPTQGALHYAKDFNLASIFTITQKTSDSLFMELTVFENALLFEQRLNKKIGTTKQFKAGIKTYLNTFHAPLANALDISINDLSGGEQQILMLALCMRHQPKLLLLDEHTSALDPKTAEKVMQFTNRLIQQSQVTCIMTCHNLEFALRFGNRLMAMKEGEIAYETNEKSKITRETLLSVCY